MKKVLYLISLLALIVVPNIASAHLESGADCIIGIRTEVSKDNGATWYSYDSSDATDLGTGYSLQVTPGDNVKIRIKVWNEGSNLCSVATNGVATGFTNLENLSGDFDNPDEDGDTVDFTESPGGPLEGFLNPGVSGGSAVSGYQSATINATVKSTAAAGATMSLAYTVAQGEPLLAMGSHEKSLAQKVVDKLVPVAHADRDGTATSEMRIVVASATTTPVAATVTELPKTGPSAYLFLLPIAFILPAYFLISRKVTAKLSK
jgi:hypothetical protein